MSDSQPNFHDFLFVGTAKAGTTSIYNYLVQHPEISIPKKETFYFIRNLYPKNLLAYPKQREEKDIVRDSNALKKLFSGIEQGKVTGEIGTGYLHNYETAIPEILKLAGPKTKILMVLRNPIERTFSGYMHFKKFSFQMESLKDEIQKEKERREQEYDFMWQFSGLSFYSESVMAYQKAFENVKVLFYEDLKEHPSEFMHEVVDFIGVEAGFEFDTSKSFNPSGTPINEGLQKVITGDYWLKRKLRPIYHSLLGKKKVHAIRDGMRDKNLARVRVSSEEREYLRTLFLDDIRNLQGILDNKVNLFDKWGIEQA